jgi:hypothetical protein
MNIGHQTIMFMPHFTLNITNSLHNKCMNVFYLPEKYYISILDGGEYTFVLVQEREVCSVHNTRRANVVGFDYEAALKRNLPIVSEITAVDLPNGISVILIVMKQSTMIQPIIHSCQNFS